MSKKSSAGYIRLRGVRHNNLKNFNLDLPLGRLVVITGLSGSGKSSLAFDTLYAEGQRRYIETFSPYARQFFDRMDKPQVDRIEGIPPAIALEQKNSVKTSRSTLGTMTEICDYLKLVWPHVSTLYCSVCHQAVVPEPPQWIWEQVRAPGKDAVDGARADGAEVLITFDLGLSEKLSWNETVALIRRQGFQRVLWDHQPVRLEDLALPGAEPPRTLIVIQDRLKLADSQRSRFIDACEQAYHFGKGKLAVRWCPPAGGAGLIRFFSQHLHCATCDLVYQSPTPGLFSFNHPIGACPECRGFGRVITIDYQRAIPDRTKSLAAGAIKPWQTGHGEESQRDLMRICRERRIPTEVPFDQLDPRTQEFIVSGDPRYGQGPDHEWPRAWYGLKGYFRWLETKAYKMHVRVLLSRYRAYETCPKCQGNRLNPQALAFKAAFGPTSAGIATPISLADFYRLTVREALATMEPARLQRVARVGDALALVLEQVRSRLRFLVDVGLGYLTLDRATRTLSGGEVERVNLTTCLGTGLVNTLFVLDEPSVGLHPRDTERLVDILMSLKDAGNSVVVVEHEPIIISAADEIIDLGPGQGPTGGQIVFQGTYPRLLRSANSLTGQYLSGRKQIPIPSRRRVVMAADGTDRDSSRSNNAVFPSGKRTSLVNRRAPDALAGVAGAPMELREVSAVTRELTPALGIERASANNLKSIAVQIPLNRLVCLTGVSGSGKTTLVREVMLPALARCLNEGLPPTAESDREETAAFDQNTEPGSAPSPAVIKGWEQLGRVVLVDQSPLGKTPRSNPAVYLGAFDHIRALFAESPMARGQGLTASGFSFNSVQGQCEKCRGAGFEKIEMQFLSDVFIRCPACEGKRYRPHILDVTISPRPEAEEPATLGERGHAAPDHTWNIGRFLDASIDEAVAYLAEFRKSRAAARAIQRLEYLQRVGLGYLRMGQPINTLSGGECQRLKLVWHLAELAVKRDPDAKPILFLFDEPTTGLHFHDVRVLLGVFHRLVDEGHSLVVIEHNLEVIKSADWIIDLGPEAGAEGGQIIATGTPESVARVSGSHTGKALRTAGISL